jgi:F-type H+-transporting ATPase subunit a
MEEHAEEPAGHGAKEAHGEAAEHGQEGGGAQDPTHHIQDKVLFGVNANTGAVVGYPYQHGHAIAGYAPKTIGPMKLEFTKHMADVTVVAALLMVAGLAVSRKVLAGISGNHAPRGRLANLVESILVYVRDEVVVPVGGHHLAHYTPLFLTYFMFILTCNLIGMLPDVGTATGNVGVTMALGGSVYVLIWLLGMAHQGPVNFVLHLVPPGTPWWMWPLMFVLELMGPVIKCFVLCVRLFANMVAGHLIIGSLLMLTVFGPGAMLPAVIAGLMIVIGVPLALGISCLELLVALIQAYVFTLLAVTFIGAAVHPEH